MLRFGKCQKQRWNAVCCGVADQNQWASVLTPQCIKQKHAESNVERNRAIRSFFDLTTRGTVGSSLSRPSEI
jgi:hypothetical protein